jgi:DNA polymerase-3 subunit delta'
MAYPSETAPVMWQCIIGHDAVVARWRTILEADRLASTYLFVGKEGIGKRTVAMQLAQGILCQANGLTGLDACGACPSCRLAEAGNHPDFQIISRPPDRAALPLEAFIGSKERRHREGLCHALALKPQLSGRKVAVIDDCDDLTQEAANGLLKTLEEPPAGSLLILVGTSTQRQLPTILSRCQVLRFAPLDNAQIATVLRTKGLAASDAEADRLAAACDGSIAWAAELADKGLWELRDELFRQLAAIEWDVLRLTKMVADFVDRNARDPAARRRRIRQVMQMAAVFFRELMRAAVGVPPHADQGVLGAVRNVLSRGAVDVDQVVAQVERCLLAMAEVDRNLNQATLLACWLDDLEKLGTGRPVNPAGAALMA